MKSRHINLSEESRKLLVRVWHTGKSSRERNRAHALLLSDSGKDINSLSTIFFVGRDAISDWFNRWESLGIEGLKDTPKSGRPTIFSEEEKKK